MKHFNIKIIINDKICDKFLTIDDLNQFLNAKDFKEQIKILTIHSQKNQNSIKKEEKYMENNEIKQEEIENEVKDVNDQFAEFLHTKGIKAKFKLAFANMAESAKKQKEQDKANFEAVKEKSREENKEFVEFLHTKGFKAKCHLVIENIKKSAKENSARIKEETKARAQAQKALATPHPYSFQPVKEYSADELTKEFNEFLISKGLDSKYSVVITEE